MTAGYLLLNESILLQTKKAFPRSATNHQGAVPALWKCTVVSQPVWPVCSGVARAGVLKVFVEEII